MADETTKEFAPEFQYIVDCFSALNEHRYSDAMRSLEAGLNSNLNDTEQLDVKALLTHLTSLLGYLEFRLEEDFGIRSGTEVSSVTRRCSFCGKEQSEAARLIAGPGVFICLECANSCAELLRSQ